MAQERHMRPSYLATVRFFRLHWQRGICSRQTVYTQPGIIDKSNLLDNLDK